MLNLTVKQVRLFDTFEKIEANSGRNDKKTILSTATAQEKVLLELALNPYKQFHITSWGRQFMIDKWASDDIAYQEFINLINYAMKTNHCSLLVDKTEKFMSSCNELQAKWFGRILEKDLRMGILEKSVNEVLGEGFVPGMYVMLAHPLKDVKKPFHFGNAIVERKYDGFRCIVIYRMDGLVDVIGRSGKPIENLEFCKRLEENKDKLKGLVLDGEAFCPNLSFESVSSVLRTADAVLLPDFRMYLFDTMTLEAWERKFCSIPYINRIKEREELAKLNSFLYPIEWFEIKEAFLDKAMEKINALYEQFLEEGYEGGMLKDPTSLYEWKRSKSLIKLKPEEHADAVITGFVEGEGNIAGMLGAFICDLEDGKQIQVGGGYKLWERRQYWVNPNQYVGQWIRVKYTMKTAEGALRHPVFKGFRDKK